jgi:hypothetical protein
MTAEFTLNTDYYKDIDVEVTFHWQDDSIGSYEFWGAKGCMPSQYYPVIDNIDAIYLDDKIELIEYLKSKYNQIIEELTEKIINLYL